MKPTFCLDDNCYYEKVGNEVKNITEEIPFEIPDSWCWCRHNDLFEICGGSQPPKSKFITYPKEGYVRLYQIRDYGKNPDPVYIPISTASKMTKKGDILLARYGASLGKVFWAEFGAYNVAMAKILKYFSSDFINDRFLFYYYKAGLYQELVLNNSRSAQAGFNKDDLNSLLFVIPPLEEQRRIVLAIEQYEPLIAEYDAIEKQATKLDGEIKDKLRKSILQYAIQGKLVPQDKTDEPASVLLERIRAEKKAQLGKKYVDSYIYKGDDNCYYEKVGGTIRNITDEIPFDIPESWEWTRINNVFEVNPTNHALDTTQASFVAMKSIKEGYNNTFEFEEKPWKTIQSGFTHFSDGDIGFAKITPCFQNRKSVIFDNLANGIGAGTTELHILRPYKNTLNSNYVLWFVKAPYFIDYGVSKFSGTAGQQRFSTDELKKMLIPIPPQHEQFRIVRLIKNLFQSINGGAI